MKLLVPDGQLFDLVVGMQMTQKMSARLKYGNKTATFPLPEGDVVLPLWEENKMEAGDGPREEFTSSPEEQGSTSDERTCDERTDDERGDDDEGEQAARVVCLIDAIETRNPSNLGHRGIENKSGCGASTSAMIREDIFGIRTSFEEKDTLLDDALGNLTEEDQENIHQVLLGEGVDGTIIAWELSDLRPMEILYVHKFQMKEPKVRPVCHPLRRTSRKEDEILRREVEIMLKSRVIRPAESAWGSREVIADKKDGGDLFCVDYRALNKMMKGEKFLIPKIEEIIDELKYGQVLSRLNLLAGYWKVNFAEHLQEMRTFRCKYTSFKFYVTPFGLMNAPECFLRMASELFDDLHFVSVYKDGLRFVSVYIDDVVVNSHNTDELLQHLLLVMEKVWKVGLMLKITKCEFMKRQMELLGHLLSARGVETDQVKDEKVAKAPTPTSKKQLRSLYGLASFYRIFVKNFAIIAAPLNELTTDGTKLEWRPKAEESFGVLKYKLTSPPVLVFPD